MQSVITQTIANRVAPGSISLACSITYLTVPIATPPVPLTIPLPDGNQKGQMKEIYIPASSLATTETFIITGTFAAFTSLQMNAIGSSALLSWDGAAWQWVGGNAAITI